MEALILALRTAGLCASFVRMRSRKHQLPLPPPPPRRPRRVRATLGYLVGTGGHYVALVPEGGGGRWRLVDNGLTTGVDRSPKALLRTRVRAVAAVLRVRVDKTATTR